MNQYHNNHRYLQERILAEIFLFLPEKSQIKNETFDRLFGYDWQFPEIEFIVHGLCSGTLLDLFLNSYTSRYFEQIFHVLKEIKELKINLEVLTSQEYIDERVESILLTVKMERKEKLREEIEYLSNFEDADEPYFQKQICRKVEELKFISRLAPKKMSDFYRN